MTWRVFAHLVSGRAPAKRGAGPAVTDVIAGRVDVIFNTFGSTLALVRDGQLRGLAVTSARRFPAAPELPSIAEAALPGFDVTAWYALYVPAQTPPDIVRKLNADVVAVLAEPAIRDKMELLGVAVIGSTPEELARHLRAETQLWEFTSSMPAPRGRKEGTHRAARSIGRRV